MNCVKIVTDDQNASVEISGTPLDCYCILGSATVKALEKIIPDMSCRPETAINSFGSTLMNQLRERLGVESGKEKPQEEGREHVCRCQKKPAEKRKMTLEEIAEMIGNLTDGERNRLGVLIIQRAVDSLVDLAADEKPKEADKKGSGLEWASDFGTLT